MIPQSLHQLQDTLKQHPWGQYLISSAERTTEKTGLISPVSKCAGAVAEQIVLLLIALVPGFFFGLNPPLYFDNALKLVPRQRRAETRELFSDLAHTLRGWMLGQPMGVLGAGSLIGLWILGVPLALTLSLFTAMMLFIPYAGSLISLVPAALVGLTKGPMTMVWVIVIYLGVHGLEGYVVTPISQRHAIRLPPVVTISAQLLMWNLAGMDAPPPDRVCLPASRFAKVIKIGNRTRQEGRA